MWNDIDTLSPNQTKANLMGLTVGLAIIAAIGAVFAYKLSQMVKEMEAQKKRNI